jgi:signal transduction histidine kinase
VILGLTLLGGLLMSRSVLRRVDAINRTSKEIMSGDLSRRIPVSRRGDEFDQLAENLNAMLDQIERLLAAMKEVSDNIAHDLRSPLARLRSRLEVTLMEDPDDAAYRETIGRTIEEADGLLKTFNGLLSIAQAEAGAARAGFAPVDLATLVADVAELYEPLAEDLGLALAVEVDEAGTIRGDRNLLFQALANLVDNALKYSPPESRVTLRLARQADRVALSVSDHGPGIPAEARARVKERFVRLESSRSTPGSGLGLSLVAAVAELHGGTLELADNGPGLIARLELPKAA